MSNVPQLVPRPLGRTDRTIAPVVWELTSAHPDAQSLLAAHAAGATWFIVGSQIALEGLRQIGRLLPADAHLLLAVAGDDLVSRSGSPLEERLNALGRRGCDGIIVEDVTSNELKAGRPFHRLNQLRDDGVAEVFAIDAATLATADWVVEQSPAHAVALPFGMKDLTARYHILPAAEELGTAVLARRPERSAWQSGDFHSPQQDIAFCLSHPTISATIEPLPGNVAELEQVLCAVRAPMGPDVRDELWTHFQAQVPAPKKGRSGHAMDDG